ncbi:SH3 domain-containing protein [Hymenobacter sp. HD11105]
MSKFLRLAPVRRQAGEWRINWWQLVGWTMLVNTVFGYLVYYYTQPVPSRLLSHPAAVMALDVPLLSHPTTDLTATTMGVVTQGDTLEVHAVQANGWCRASLREAPWSSGRGATGYIQTSYLSLLDSTKFTR